MGVKFSKIIPLHVAQIVPPEQEKTQITKLQQRLLDKLGGSAYPFLFKFPSSAPSSVVILSGEANDKSKPLGVEYRVRAFVAESAEDAGHKRSTASLAIKKVSLRLPIELESFIPIRNQVRFFRFSCNTRLLFVWIDYPVHWHRKVSPSLKAESPWK